MQEIQGLLDQQNNRCVVTKQRLYMANPPYKSWITACDVDPGVNWDLHCTCQLLPALAQFDKNDTWEQHNVAVVCRGIWNLHKPFGDINSMLRYLRTCFSICEK